MAASLPEHGAETEEVDIWWGSYAGRTMLPGLLLCLGLTIALLLLEWYLERKQQRTDLLSSVFLGLMGAMWLFQLTHSLYRMIAINYRLTNRRLLSMRGFKLPESWQLELAQVTEVTVMQGALERLLGVGRLLVRGPKTDSPLLLLEGVRRPERVARLLRRKAQQARMGRAKATPPAEQGPGPRASRT